MTMYIQGGMSKQMLKGERIAAAVHKILSRKGVPEHVEAGFLNTTLSVIFGYGAAQTIF